MDPVWIDFQQNVLQRALQEADRLVRTTDEETDPYKGRFAAAEVINRAKEQADLAQQKEGLNEQSGKAFATAYAVLETRWGLLLLETDQASQAEEAIAKGTKTLAQNPYQHLTLLQDVFNSLGILWSGRKNPQKSLDLLQQGEALYNAWLAALFLDHTSPDAREESSTGRESARAQPSAPSLKVQRLAKDKYAHTLFYMAQIYGMLGDRDKSAFYCAGTLTHQLELGIQDHIEWAENCEQLANYYISSSEIAVAEHLLNCSEAAMKLAPGSSSSSVPGGKAAVEADIAIAWAKLYSKRLALSSRLCSGALQTFEPALQSLPESVRFTGLQTSAAAGLHWDGGLATSMAEANDLFNSSMRKLKEALDYYVLDGHVTMHCNVILEVSELYRWLADFETEPHRKCVLHKARAKRVEPLLRQLNSNSWPDIYRALHLDVGNAYREIADIKFEENRPHDKIAAAAAEAKPHYEAYVNTFRKDGKLPLKVERSEEEDLFVNAVFFLARVTSRLDPPVSSGNFEQTEHLREAVDLYRFCADYIKCNNVTSQQQLGDTCMEMATLIAENAEMMRVNAARKLSGNT